MVEGRLCHQGRREWCLFGKGCAGFSKPGQFVMAPYIGDQFYRECFPTVREDHVTHQKLQGFLLSLDVNGKFYANLMRTAAKRLVRYDFGRETKQMKECVSVGGVRLR